MAAREEIIAFQKKVFSGGTAILKNEYSNSFDLLGSLPCQAASDAIGLLRAFQPVEFEILAKALPRRGKPSELLHVLGEELSPDEQAMLSRYDIGLRSISIQHSLSRRGKLIDSELRSLLPQIATGIGNLTGPTVAKVGESTLFLEREHKGIKIRTILDISERMSRIGYFQHFYDVKGDQLNGFPLSILEMCGISAVTSFDIDARLTAESLISSISCSIQHTFNLVLGVARSD